MRWSRPALFWGSCVAKLPTSDFIFAGSDSYSYTAPRPSCAPSQIRIPPSAVVSRPPGGGAARTLPTAGLSAASGSAWYPDEQNYSPFFEYTKPGFSGLSTSPRRCCCICLRRSAGGWWRAWAAGVPSAPTAMAYTASIMTETTRDRNFDARSASVRAFRSLPFGRSDRPAARFCGAGPQMALGMLVRADGCCSDRVCSCRFFAAPESLGARDTHGGAGNQLRLDYVPALGPAEHLPFGAPYPFGSVLPKSTERRLNEPGFITGMPAGCARDGSALHAGMYIPPDVRHRAAAFSGVRL